MYKIEQLTRNGWYVVEKGYATREEAQKSLDEWEKQERHFPVQCRGVRRIERDPTDG